MEKQLLKKLLNYKFYLENKHRVLDTYFPSILSSLWKTIQKAHEEYATDLTPTWTNQLFKKYNPQASGASKSNVANLLDDIEHEEEPPDDMASDLLAEFYKKEKAREAAETAIKVINGESSMGELIDFLDTFDRVDFTEDDNFEEVEFDLDNILDFNSMDNLFPFRLSSMQERIPGAGRGHFVVLFARPEAGKTAFSVYQAAGYLQQGLKVAYFANEESAKRVYLRLMCSALEVTEDSIRQDVEGTRIKFKDTYSKNLAMIDGVGMGVEQIENWVAKNKPDVVFVDQLDKLSVKGAFNRGDERLGRLYTLAREMAKRNNCLVYGVTQCSAEGEGKTKLDYSMMAGSKTDKAAEADLIIGIGKRPQVGEEEMIRTIGISKNKINSWHGFFGSTLDKYRGMYLE
tara:strand:+ start:3479 stop:4684 length:1206 start_codon:yes stop_codon:yes gene_type:complete